MMGSLGEFWSLLSLHDRRRMVLTIFVCCIGAVANVVVVGSLFPFLALISNPDAGSGNAALEAFRAWVGVDSHVGLLRAVAFATALSVCLATALIVLRSHIVSRFVAFRAHALASRAFRAAVSRNMVEIAGRDATEDARIINQDSTFIARAYAGGLLELMTAAMTLIGVLLVLFLLSPAITLASILGFGGFYTFYFLAVGRSAQQLGADRLGAMRARNQLATSVLRGLKSIKIQAAEESFSSAFDTSSHVVATSEARARFRAELPRHIVQAVFLVGVIVMTLVFIAGNDPEAAMQRLVEAIPVMGVFAVAAQRMLPEIQRAYSALSVMNETRAALTSLSKMTECTEPLARPDISVSFDRGDIVIENAWFSHEGSKTPSLQGLDLVVPRGGSLGIAGSSGSGKTSALDLLLGLMSPQRGRVMSGDTDINASPEVRRAWGNHVGYVPQETVLLNATLAENVALGIPRNEVDMDRLNRAAEIAQLAGDVVASDADWDRPVQMDDGLSGGQKQRIGIARALYSEPRILVLDEATSALDADTEARVMEALKSLPDTTLVMVAHRLTTLRDCSSIAVLERGRTVEAGSWDQLLSQKDGRFHALYAAMTGSS